MRILLIGEFSRLHNSLKEGLQELGHDVVLIGNGDGFKNYPVDLSTKAKFCESKLGAILRKIFYKILKLDIARIEFGVRFYFHLKKLKNFDVVQLINESSIQTLPVFERYLIKKIFQNNKKVYLLCCGVDYIFAQFLIDKKNRYSIMNPYFENPKSKKEYDYIFEFLTSDYKKTHQLIYQNIQGVIASDLDYVFPLLNNNKFLGLIPNPINTSKIEYKELEINDKIVVFLGINRSTYYTKGISFFEEALKIIKGKYPNKVEFIVVENLPYRDYIQKYNQAHIVLDQVYSFDQGYNALEAMAKGKVVFTGAEKEFEEHYNLTEKVAINALPNINSIVKELSFLIENPTEIEAMGKRARDFINREHDGLKVAQKYLDCWALNAMPNT